MSPGDHLNERVIDSFVQMIRSNDWVIRSNDWVIHDWDRCLWIDHWIFESSDSFQNAESFSNEKTSCCDLCLTIFAAETEQKQSILHLKCKWLNCNCLLTCCMKSMSQFQLWLYSGNSCLLVKWGCLTLSYVIKYIKTPYL